MEYWIKAKCPKCGNWNKIKNLKEKTIEYSVVLGTAVVELEIKCQKCNNVFVWEEGRIKLPNDYPSTREDKERVKTKHPECKQL